MRGGGPRGDVGAVLLDQQGGFVGAVVEEALPAGDFGGRFRRAFSAGKRGGEEGRVDGEAIELGEGVAHLRVGLK